MKKKKGGKVAYILFPFLDPLSLKDIVEWYDGVLWIFLMFSLLHANLFLFH